MGTERTEYRGYWIEVARSGSMWEANVVPVKSGMAMPRNLPMRAAIKDDALSGARHRIDELESIQETEGDLS